MADSISPTWKRILEHLRLSGAQSSAQVGRAMSMTAMGARQHLLRLESDGLVASRFEKGRAGRPALVFELCVASDKHFPQSYDRFAESLLTELEESDGREKIRELFARRRDRLRKQYLQRLSGESDRTRRLQILAELRDGEGYMAEVQDMDDGAPALIEHNCPISTVAKKYPEVCQMEIELFQSVLETEVQRTEHIVSGHRACVYRIGGSTGCPAADVAPEPEKR